MIKYAYINANGKVQTGLTYDKAVERIFKTKKLQWQAYPTLAQFERALQSLQSGMLISTRQ